MAALGDWLLNMMKLAVMGVVVYSICIAIGNKTIANLAKLLAILMAVQITYTAIADPVQKAHKKVTEWETRIDKVQNFFGTPEPKPKPEEKPTAAKPTQLDKSH